MGSHRSLVNVPALTPAMQAGARFTYPEGWKAELTLVVSFDIPLDIFRNLLTTM